MKALTFNKSSWHYLLATKVGNYDPPARIGDSDEWHGDSADICTYSRKVLLGILLLSIAGAVIAGAGFLFWHLIFGLIFSLLCGCYLFSDVGTAVLIMVGIGTSFIGGAFAIKAFNEWKYKRKLENKGNQPAEDSFIEHAFKSWKGKFCMQIEFKE